MSRKIPAFILPLLVFLFITSGHAQDKTSELDELLATYHDYRLFNGSVLAARGDQIIYEKGFGEAVMEWDIPNSPETRFRIGSITKHFTSTIILQLVEEGKIDLQGKITDYLPDYPKSQGDRVTIHHLLTHTSGIPSYTGLPDFSQKYMREPYEPDSFITVFSGMDLEFEPGTTWRYNNSGYFLLGVIIEKVTDQPYDQAVRERLLQPLGLVNTGYDHFGEIVENRAMGYVRAASGYEHAPYLDTGIPYAAGMLYSTVRDLHKWTRALHTGKLFRQPETFQKMTTPYMEHYGYGLGINEQKMGDKSVRVIGHGGGINGFASMLNYYPDDEITIVVLDNTSQNAGRVADDIARILYDQPVTRPARPISDVLAEVIESEGIDAAVKRYHDLKQSQSEAYDFREQELNSLGYLFLQQGDAETAIRIFQLNVEAYPNAFNTYDSLGEAYLAAGNREQAIANYKKAFELNPGFENAKQALKRLGVNVEEPDVEVPAEMIDAYVGRYELRPDLILEVTREGTQLFIQGTGHPRVEVFPLSQNQFYPRVFDARFTFNRDPSGKVESLTLLQGGSETVAKRLK